MLECLICNVRLLIQNSKNVRPLSTGSVRLVCRKGNTKVDSKKFVSKQSRVMNKLMQDPSSKRRVWYRPKNSAVSISVPDRNSFAPGGRNTRRVAVLNKLFMKHITDLLASGEVASEIVGRGVEISRVKISADFNHVNVFWLAKGTEEDATVEEILTKSAWDLRHELSQLRVMGQIPRIEFVKDKLYASVVEVDRLLSKADFGDDFEPVDPTLRLRSEFTLNTELSPTIKKRIMELEDGAEEEPEGPLPPMRMDVLGVNHATIMDKIMKSLKLSEAAHRRKANTPPLSDPCDIQDSVESHDVTIMESLNSSQRNAEFTKFLKKRQVMRAKAQQSYENNSPEIELHETDDRPVEDSDLYNEFCDDEEKDYIEDFDIEYKDK